MNPRRRAVAVATVVAAAALILGVPAMSEARQVEGIEIVFANGRVSITVDQAAASQVLSEWARIGQTDIVGHDLPDERIVTGLKLEDVPEGEALEAILGQSFGFVQLLRDAEPGLSSIRRLVIGAVAAPTDEEKQDKKDKKEKKPKKIKDWDPTIPPEAQFDYYVPPKSETGEVYGPPVYEHLVVPAPETRFEYLVPEKSTTGEVYGPPDYSPMDPNRPVPEKTFEYFLKEFTTVYPVEPPGKIPTTYPEVRFTYYTPPKG
jgi:hypothetical protein